MTDRCPVCRSALFFPTDGHGRVLVWCDGCNGSPAMPAPPPPPKTRAPDVRRPPTRAEVAAINGAAGQHASIRGIANAVGITEKIIYDWRKRGLVNLVTREQATRAKHDAWQAVLDAGAPWASHADAARAIGSTESALYYAMRRGSLSVIVVAPPKRTGRRGHRKWGFA